MKASDLRKGNIVTDQFYEDFKTTIEVESVCEEGINVYANDDGKPYGMHSPILEYEYSYDELKGIPLTEDWMVKFGFRLTEKADYINIDFDMYSKGSFSIEECSLQPYLDNEVINPLLYVKYVHQLQNLYRSLTGEELTI